MSLRLGFDGLALTAGAGAEIGPPAEFDPASLFATAVGAWYSPTTPNTLSKKRYEWDPATAEGDDVALILDKSQGLALGSEQKASVTVGQAGTSTAGTYNTGTGAGTIAAASAGNESFVQLAGLAAGFTYVIDIENTNAFSGFSIRQTNTAGTVLHTLLPSTRKSIYFTGATTFVLTVNSSANVGRSFTIHSIKHLAGTHARSPDDGAGRGVIALRNGHKVIAVDGVGDWFISPSNTAWAGYTALSLYGGIQKNAETLGYAFTHNAAAVGSCTLRSDTAARAITSVRGTVTTSNTHNAFASPSTMVMGLRYVQGSRHDSHVNANYVAGVDAGFTSVANAMSLGATTSGASFFTGEVGEIIYTIAAVTDEQHADLMAYVNARIGAY